jgi:hypothetical protein
VTAEGQCEVEVSEKIKDHITYTLFARNGESPHTRVLQSLGRGLTVQERKQLVRSCWSRIIHAGEETTTEGEPGAIVHVGDAGSLRRVAAQQFDVAS